MAKTTIQTIPDHAPGATFAVTALTNDRARLIVSTTTTDSPQIAKLVRAAYDAAGHAVTVVMED